MRRYNPEILLNIASGKLQPLPNFPEYTVKHVLVFRLGY
jgi:hypothetical protein